MRRFHQRGLTLLELLVTITVTMVVLAGTMAMFTKINQSVLDTNRNNDFTFQNRSLIDLMKQDFQRAGKGMNDFSVFNVHAAFNSSFAVSTSPVLYPVADLAYDDTNKTSEIILHYFDYDISGASDENPTFFAMLDGGDTGTFGDNMTYINLMSNDEASIDGLAEGDMIMIYRFDALRQGKAFRDADKNPWESQLVDGKRTNDAVVLQVTSTESKIAEGGDETTVQFRRKVNFGNGAVFNNTIDTTSFQTSFEDGMNNPDIAIANMATWLFESSESRVPGLRQTGLFFARKLGTSDSFRRVHYKVENRSGNRVLIRNENGVEEVVAENVEEFSVRLGVDVPKGSAAEVIQNDQMDGYVSGLDPTQWTRAYDDPDNGWSVTGQQFSKIIGRHAVAAMVKLVQQVDYPDPGSGDPTFKTRAFEHQFKLSMTRPSQYQISNPND